MNIAVVANTAWYLQNFRLNLMRRLRACGHHVIAVSGPGDVSLLREEGIPHRAIPLSEGGKGPAGELRAVLRLRAVLKAERIDVALSYTPKGNLYTALARTGVQCRQVANVSGLGSSFLAHNWVSLIVHLLYRVTLKRVDWTFFQNEDDRQLFIEQGLVRPERCERIMGSGVDLTRFAFEPLPPADRGPVFLMIARAIADKGVREYAQAAAELKRQRPQARCRLLGSTQSGNPTAIPASEIEQWATTGVLEVLGHQGDVRPAIREASCVVLPSYREGLARSLLEGAAMGRPLIATDVPGCREVIDDDANGFLCRPRDAASLLEAMVRYCDCAPVRRAEMGRHSRQKVEATFSEEAVLRRYEDVLANLDPRGEALRARTYTR
jgi:glycosyltransferase involved in cell wall biosynthesis